MKTITHKLKSGVFLLAMTIYTIESFAQMAVGTNFWVTGWGTGQKEYFKTGQNWATIGSGTNWKTANPWRDDFIAEISMYNTFRFMDWQRTVGATDVNWSDRVKPTTDHFNNGGKVALEWCVNLANRLNKNVWFCVPHAASDDYIKQMAIFLRDNLEVDRKIYIEYSNETWNEVDVFTQSDWCIQKGEAGNYPGINKWYKGEAYSMHRSLQVFGIFEGVFGSANMGRWNRVRRVVGAGANLDFNKQALKNVYKSTKYNPNNRIIDFLAIAPYGGASGADGAASDVATKFRAHVDKTYNERIVPLNQTRIDNGIAALTTYEVGQHITINADKWSANPKIYDEYRYMMSKYKPMFNLFIMHYVHVGAWNSGNAWGAKKYTGQPLTEAHKYRALKDWQAANPAREEAEEENTSTIVVDSDVMIYPNPSSGIVNINVSGGDVKVNVYNSMGTLVASTYTIEGLAVMNLLNSGAGMYIIELSTEAGDILRKKIAIE